MSLRAKLILAFLALSVVPLAGVTSFSYVSSVDAFEETVRRQAEATTVEMGRRMGSVTAELQRRFDRLGALPYEKLAETATLESAPGAERPEARKFVADLLRQMGDSAYWVQSFEFLPRAPQPPQPPVPAAPHVPAPDVGPIVVQLSRLWSDRAAAADGARDTGRAATERPWIEVVRHDGTTVLTPHRTGDGGGPSDEMPGWVDELVAALTADPAAGDAERQARLEALGQRFADQVAGSKVAAASDAASELRLEAEVLQREVASAAPTAPAGSDEAPHARGLPIEDAVERDGAVVGRIRATLDARRVLGAVLGRTRVDEGEIPFAVDTDGTLYTVDPQAESTLRELGIDDAVAGGAVDGPRRVAGNWIVLTRHDPGMDVVFGLARPVGDSLDAIRRATARNLGWGLGMIAVAMLGVVPLSGRMTRHLRSLSDGVDRLAGGDLDARVDVATRDEIGRLAVAFNRMAGQLAEQRGRLVAQERLRKELEMCRQIQEELLPRRRGRLGDAELHAVSIPARELGGDFFNYFPLSDGGLALLMGDVSGKGIPAALLMANLQAMLRARLPVQPDLARLADEVDRELEDSTPREAYLTLFVAVVDPGGGRLRYVNAGHNAQYLCHPGGRIEPLGSSGRPLGLLAGGGYTEGVVELQPGDLLCLFTDGLVEAENPAGEFFGERHLETLLREAGDATPEAIVAAIESAVSAHRAGADAADDATMLVVRVGLAGSGESALAPA